MDDLLIKLPDFAIDSITDCDVKIEKIRFQNFKAFEDYTLDLTDSDDFACFIGPNGTGKTTILETINMIFSRSGRSFFMGSN